MICVAANDHDSLESVERLRAEIYEIEPSKPIALILTKAHKLDIIDDGVDVSMIKKKAKELGLAMWAKTSAKAWEDFNVHKAFNKVLETAYNYKYDVEDLDSYSDSDVEMNEHRCICGSHLKAHLKATSFLLPKTLLSLIRVKAF